MDLEKYRKYFPAAGVIGGLLFLWLTFFSVRETEFVLVTQFGRPLYTVTEAGLHMKWLFQTATYFDRRLRVYNPRPSEFLTRDKKNLVIESYVAWKIQDPKRFVETVKAREMLDNLTSASERAALAQYGIQVVDVRIKRLNLPEQNKQSVYARMRAERERIARQYRAEGEEQALRIRADADRQKEELLSVAYKQAEKTKGEGDAESTKTYSQAYSRNPRFYKLMRTLEAYKKIFDDKTTAILSSDSELLKVLMRGENAQ